jgi:hypothetical protein
MEYPLYRKLLGPIINFIGGSLRWIYGLTLGSILKKPKFTFKEYISGPENTIDFYDKTSHNFNNHILGWICIGILLSILL